MVYLLVAGTVANCSIVTQTCKFVREKVSFTPHENHGLPYKIASLSAILINVMAENFEVLRTCRGSVVMATINEVMFSFRKALLTNVCQ